jgi:hypothetical protein
MKKTLRGLFVAMALSSFAIDAGVAQEKSDRSITGSTKVTNASPANVLFEDERVRVTESRYKPGEKNEMKMRADRVIIPLQDSKLRYHFPDGKTEDVEHNVGKAHFRKKGTSQVENIGSTESRNILVTLK